MGDGSAPSVNVTCAYKRYSPKVVVLNGLNMNVEYGSIYGLLGPSGCGKTTLLSVIVGQQRLDAGEVRLRITSKTQVGYMPQEIALDPELEIHEVFGFYGQLCLMEAQAVKERQKYLSELLELPNLTKKVGQCSGGQQRRISMAVALLHDPELLILDEPTVGLDPVLCDKIWKYFIDIVRTQKKTIMITTHYIEEAKNANAVGLMRGGILLAEENPHTLLRRHNMDSLEDVFLRLSAQQEEDMNENQTQEAYPSGPKPKRPLQDNNQFNVTRCKAQLLKNYRWAVRNYSITLFILMMPVVLFTLINNLSLDNFSNNFIGVVNNEAGNCKNISGFHPPNDCLKKPIPFSCRYTDMVNDKIPVKLFGTEEEGLRAMKRKKVFALLVFDKDWTPSLMERIEFQADTYEESVDSSIIVSWIDSSDYITYITLKQVLGTKMLDFLEEVHIECGYEPKFARPAVEFLTPTYGRPVDDPLPLATQVAPGYLTGFLFYVCYMFTSSALMMEKTSGLLERAQIAGLTMLETIVAHSIIQLGMMIGQTSGTFLIMYVVYRLPMLGSFATLTVVLFLVQVMGVVYGILCALLLDIDRLIAYLGIGTVLTITMVTGSLWPIEGGHLLVRPTADFLATVTGSQAYVNISLRGRGWSDSVVLGNILSEIAGIIVLTGACMASVKYGYGKL